MSEVAMPIRTRRRDGSAPDGARWCSVGQAPITLDRAGMLSDPEPVFEVYADPSNHC